jgi:hypothetical protein
MIDDTADEPGTVLCRSRSNFDVSAGDLPDILQSGVVAMKQTALAAFLAAGLAVPAMGAEQVQRIERADIPTAADATLADCQVWLDQLSGLVDEAEVPDEVLQQAREQRDQVAQACDDGRYIEGIELADATIDMLEEAFEEN